MKILVIMGSPRKGNTYHAAERIGEILQEKVTVEWEYVMLRDVELEQCRGCYTCFNIITFPPCIPDHYPS